MAELENSGKKPTPPIRVTDRRPRFDESPAGDRPAEETVPRYPSFVAELKEKALASESKLAEALNLLRKREVEADDFRARLRREMERRARTEMETWLKDILEVLDSLDRGIAAAEESGESTPREGLVKIRDQFLSILARHGVQPMELLGTTYDPHLAEAVAVSPSSTPEGESRILQVLRRGYLLRGEVLRPAQVVVAGVLQASIPVAEAEANSPTEG